MFWKTNNQTSFDIKDINNLPPYGFEFFLKNIGRFKTGFLLLTIVRIISSSGSFAFAFLLGSLLNQITTLTLSRLFTFYIPLFVFIRIGTEILDIFTRKYAEAFPKLYTDQLKLSFYGTFLRSSWSQLQNFSKERLTILVDKYINNVSMFLNEWVWSTPDNLVRLVLIAIVLYLQNPLILFINVFFVFLLMVLALRLSKRYAKVESEFIKEDVEMGALVQNLTINLNTVKRLNIIPFFENKYIENLNKVWGKFKNVRIEHSNRWFIQLMLYNVIYIFTFSYGIYQVITGALPLGFLILLQWSYSNLWGIIVHFIGVMVGLVQQRENTKLVNSTFAKLALSTATTQGRFPEDWDKIKLTDISIQIKNTKGLPVNIKVPQLTINKKDKIGILGESGSGKSTFLHTLLGLTRYSGKYYIDKFDARALAIMPKNINIINNSEPLFNISIRDNILLGKNIDNERLDYLMYNLQITRFFKNLDVIIGDKDTHFSSGQLQRLRILRGLLSDSQIYLLDEPFNGIDDENKERIIQFLMEYLKDKTVILVTHNKEELKLINKNYQFSKNTLVAKD